MQPSPMAETSRPSFPSLRLCMIFPLLSSKSFRPERGHIDAEAVLYIGLDHSFVSFVNLLDGNDFDIGGDVVGPAEVEHLLGFGDAADVGAGEAAAAHDEAERRDRQGLRGCADQGDVAVAA